MTNILALKGPLFGMLVLLLMFFGGFTLFAKLVVAPNKALSKKLSEPQMWTPEMEYINKTRIIAGFLLGMLATGVVCIFIYAR